MSDDNDDKSPLEQVVDLFVYAPIGLFFEGPSLLPKLVQDGKGHARNARMFGEFAVRQGREELRRRLATIEDQAGEVMRQWGGAGDEVPVSPPPASSEPTGSDSSDGSDGAAGPTGPPPSSGTRSAPTGSGPAGSAGAGSSVSANGRTDGRAGGRTNGATSSPPGRSSATTRSSGPGSGAAAGATEPTRSGRVSAEPVPAVDELAITDYDSLSASQVVTRLEGLDTDELESVRRYEASHRGRKTILNKVAQIQA